MKIKKIQQKKKTLFETLAAELDEVTEASVASALESYGLQKSDMDNDAIKARVMTAASVEVIQSLNKVRAHQGMKILLALFRLEISGMIQSVYEADNVMDFVKSNQQLFPDTSYNYTLDLARVVLRVLQPLHEARQTEEPYKWVGGEYDGEVLGPVDMFNSDNFAGKAKVGSSWLEGVSRDIQNQVLTWMADPSISQAKMKRLHAQLLGDEKKMGFLGTCEVDETSNQLVIHANDDEALRFLIGLISKRIEFSA